jgi:hypothetical protein
MIGFILLMSTIICHSVSAQTKKEFKPDSLKIGFGIFQPNFDDSLKLGNSLGANDLQLPFQKDKFPRQNQNLAQVESYNQNLSDSHFRMPVLKPEYQSNMPVMKPDSLVHYHLLIKKIR